MATVSNIRTKQYGRTNLTTWSPLTSANLDGQPMSIPGASDMTVQVFGTFDSGTITIQGSNQAIPTTWATLHDVSGTPLTFTSAGIEAIAENPLHIRPLLSGAGSDSLSILILSKGTV